MDHANSSVFYAPHSPDDDELIGRFAAALEFSSAQNAAIDKTATGMIEAIRKGAGSIGGVDDFLR